MFDFIVILGMCVIALFTAVAVGCLILKVCFKIADKIFGF